MSLWEISLTWLFFLIFMHLLSKTSKAPFVRTVSLSCNLHFTLINFLSESKGISCNLGIALLTSSSFNIFSLKSLFSTVLSSNFLHPSFPILKFSTFIFLNISSKAYSVGSPIPFPFTIDESLLNIALYTRSLCNWFFKSSWLGLIISPST